MPFFWYFSISFAQSSPHHPLIAFSFDQPIKASEAKAEYKNGVLCVKIPKQDTETAKGKKLEIN